jgi:hypothetical protein
MSGNTSGHFAPDETEKPEAEAGRGELPGAGVLDLSGDDLVARAFAILADEQDRWHSHVPVPIHPGISS